MHCTICRRSSRVFSSLSEACLPCDRSRAMGMGEVPATGGGERRHLEKVIGALENTENNLSWQKTECRHDSSRDGSNVKGETRWARVVTPFARHAGSLPRTANKRP
jgi:hypothetical protein